MRKLCLTLALSLITLGAIAQEQEQTQEVNKETIKKKRPRYSFISGGLGGSALLQFNRPVYGVSAYTDINISTEAMKNYGIRGLWNGAAYFGAGVQELLLGPSLSYEAGNTIGTFSLMGGALNVFGGHDPDENGQVRKVSEWGFAYGLGYKHRFFTKHLFNLTLGLDAMGNFSGISLNPNIGFSICW